MSVLETYCKSRCHECKKCMVNVYRDEHTSICLISMNPRYWRENELDVFLKSVAMLREGSK
jgi:hypothetical protein